MSEDKVIEACLDSPENKMINRIESAKAELHDEIQRVKNTVHETFERILKDSGQSEEKLKQIAKRIEDIEQQILQRKPLTVIPTPQSYIYEYEKLVAEEEGIYKVGGKYPLLFMMVEELGRFVAENDPERQNRGYEVLGFIFDELGILRVINMFQCKIGRYNN